MAGNERTRIVTGALRNQFGSTFAMLEKLVQVCPDDVWRRYFNGDPFWYHVYHAAYFIEYWIRDDYGSQAHGMPLGREIPPEFEYDIPEDIFISREEMAAYLARTKSATESVFNALDDGKLALPVIKGRKQYTYTDVITGQIRHVMYNIGYLNGILRSLGLEESDWYSYNEG